MSPKFTLAVGALGVLVSAAVVVSARATDGRDVPSPAAAETYVAHDTHIHLTN
jgi:hypothetical protein